MVPEGTPIFAPYDGEVKTLWGDEGGNTVHFSGNGHLVRFLHLSKFAKKGKVKTGDIIGYSGNTGVSSGPHVHIDVSRGTLQLNNRKNFVDPDLYFRLDLSVVVVSIDSPWAAEKPRVDLIPTFAVHYEFVNVSGAVPVWNRDFVDMDWWKQSVGQHGSNADVVVLNMPHNLWKNTEKDGYCPPDLTWGIKPLFMKSEKNGVRRGGDEFTGRLRHELCHAIFSLKNAGGFDTVHIWDYEKNNVLGSLTDRVDLSSLPNNRKNWFFKKKGDKILATTADNVARQTMLRAVGWSQTIPKD